MSRPKTRRQKARAGLSLALTLVHDAEHRASDHARGLAAAKRDLKLHRQTLVLAHQDARRVGIL